MTDKRPTYIEGVGWRYETEHTMLRRMQGHDYQSRCIYMITLTTEGRKSVLGKLQWTPSHPEDAYVERTDLGEEVAKCWVAISSHYHGVEAYPLTMMPDHIHGLLFVKEEQQAHIGQMINGFKVGCNRAYRQLVLGFTQVQYSEALPPNTQQADSQNTQQADSQNTQQRTAKSPKHSEHGMLFAPGYQDSILMSKGQLEHMLNYMKQNPYRLAMKREHPDLFKVVRQLKVPYSEALPQNTQQALPQNTQQALPQNTQQADSQNTQQAVNYVNFAAIGNHWLLERAVRLQVRCHNNTTPENMHLIERQKAYFLERGANEQAVLVSPCISAGEKEIARAALDNHVPLIVILENGFPPMYKPPGKYFEACGDGLLLMLAPWPYHTEHRTISREQCLTLNTMAERISTEHWTIEQECKLLQSK